MNLYKQLNALKHFQPKIVDDNVSAAA